MTLVRTDLEQLTLFARDLRNKKIKNDTEKLTKILLEQLEICIIEQAKRGKNKLEIYIIQSEAQKRTFDFHCLKSSNYFDAYDIAAIQTPIDEDIHYTIKASMSKVLKDLEEYIVGQQSYQGLNLITFR